MVIIPNEVTRAFNITSGWRDPVSINFWPVGPILIISQFEHGRPRPAGVHNKQAQPVSLHLVLVPSIYHVVESYIITRIVLYRIVLYCLKLYWMHTYEHLRRMNWQLTFQDSVKLSSRVDFQDSLLSNWGAPQRWHCPLPPGGYLQVWCRDGRLEGQSLPLEHEIMRWRGLRLMFVECLRLVQSYSELSSNHPKKTGWWLDGCWKRHLVWDKFVRRVHFRVPIILSLDLLNL